MNYREKEMTEPQKSYTGKSFIRLFVYTFFSLTTILFLVLYALYLFEVKSQYAQQLTTQKLKIEAKRDQLLKHFDMIKSDLLFLPKLNELIRYIDTSNPNEIKYLIKELYEFSSHKKVYDQIRYINNDGMEVCRINYNSNGAVVVPKNELQNKHDRYYFKETCKLPINKIYISPFDLNKEHGVIEKPIKPMIRFSTPVQGVDGTPKGIIIMNYLGKNILKNIKQQNTSHTESWYLLNQEGYWLSSNNSREEWGFMYNDRKQFTLKVREPQLWNSIVSRDFSQQILDDYLITTIYLSPYGGDSHRSWILMTKTPTGTRNVHIIYFINKLLVIGGLITLILLILSIILARVIVKKNILREALEHAALYDTLTSLPNRKLLLERLERLREQCIRYKRGFGILFIDLDGFKAVNDNYGHDAGDKLLQEVASRMNKVVRKSDTVSRIGGDEFVIILDGVENEEFSSIIANKIIKELSIPIDIGPQSVKIGASIGASIFSVGSDEEIDSIMKRADEAMYMAKESGKNRVCFAKEDQ